MAKEGSTKGSRATPDYGLKGWARERQDRFWKSDFGQSMLEAGIELLYVPKSLYDARLARDVEEASDKCLGHLKGACENLIQAARELRPRGLKSVLDSTIDRLEKRRRPKAKVKTIKVGKQG
ncbi:MAG TPA: hypothetical protein ACFYED_05895 [Candidatus Tripitaka californicus]|uniref:hypothetical protein n=1 Tax=Candidatus Tripitaka californicus TaxID=3367616 RepID=UPI0040264346|nr:hypothetical protein [Planctomycetota bacterium]